MGSRKGEYLRNRGLNELLRGSEFKSLLVATERTYRTYRAALLQGSIQDRR